MLQVNASPKMPRPIERTENRQDSPNTSRGHLCLLFLLIAIASIGTIELAGRISAKTYLNKKISEINAQIAKNEDSRNPASDLIRKYRVQQYEAILERVEQLDFSGAHDFSQTIYALSSQLAFINIEATRQSQIQSSKQVEISIDEQIKRNERDISVAVINLERQLKSIIQGEGSNNINNPELSISSLIDHAMGKKAIDADKFSSLSPEIRLAIAQFNDGKARNEAQIADLRLQSTRTSNISPGIPQNEADSGILKPVAFFTLFMCYLPSDMVLALSVVICGAIGAVSASIRVRSKDLTRTSTLGLAAGFIVFLALKGGKFLFLVHHTGEASIPTNPFSAASLGILIGLFTERAYLALAQIFESTVDRITSEQAKAQNRFDVDVEGPRRPIPDATPSNTQSSDSKFEQKSTLPAG